MTGVYKDSSACSGAMKVIYYLKILLLYLSVACINVQGATINKYANAAARKILMAKSLPFEDCGE